MVEACFARRVHPLPPTRWTGRRTTRKAENLSKAGQVRGYASQTSNKVGQVSEAGGQNQNVGNCRRNSDLDVSDGTASILDGAVMIVYYKTLPFVVICQLI